MYSVLIILALIVAVLLTLIVLIQESKGGGLASGFASANALAGVRRTTDFIEKATWTLAALLVIISIATAYVIPSKDSAADVVTTMKTTTAPQLPKASGLPADIQDGGTITDKDAPAEPAKD